MTTSAAKANRNAEIVDRLEAAMREACDLLAERKYGNPARSPGHNARLCLEAALAPKGKQTP